MRAAKQAQPVVYSFANKEVLNLFLGLNNAKITLDDSVGSPDKTALSHSTGVPNFQSKFFAS